MNDHIYQFWKTQNSLTLLNTLIVTVFGSPKVTEFVNLTPLQFLAFIYRTWHSEIRFFRKCRRFPKFLSGERKNPSTD